MKAIEAAKKMTQMPQHGATVLPGWKMRKLRGTFEKGMRTVIFTLQNENGGLQQIFAVPCEPYEIHKC